MGILGEVTDYSVGIVPRGGGKLLGYLNKNVVAKIQWERKIDTFSTATITLNLTKGSDKLLTSVDPLATEIIIFRGNIPVWLGPVTGVEFGRKNGTIDARDLSTWFNWRVVHTDFVKQSRNLVQTAKELADDALMLDNPNINVEVLEGIEVGERESLSNDFLRSSDELDELMRTSVDMIVVGRNIFFYGTEVPRRQLPDFSDKDFLDDLRISRDGLSCATRVIVNGANDLWAVWPPDGEQGDSRYGLKERVFNEPSILDQDSLMLSAKSKWELLRYPLTSIKSPSGAKLSSKAPVDINDLIPGYVQKVTSTESVFAVSGLFRLDDVSVEVSGGQESVQVSYSPLGSVSD